MKILKKWRIVLSRRLFHSSQSEISSDYCNPDREEMQSEPCWTRTSDPLLKGLSFSSTSLTKSMQTLQNRAKQTQPTQTADKNRTYTSFHKGKKTMQFIEILWFVYFGYQFQVINATADRHSPGMRKDEPANGILWRIRSPATARRSSSNVNNARPIDVPRFKSSGSDSSAASSSWARITSTPRRRRPNEMDRGTWTSMHSERASYCERLGGRHFDTNPPTSLIRFGRPLIDILAQLNLPHRKIRMPKFQLLGTQSVSNCLLNSSMTFIVVLSRLPNCLFLTNLAPRSQIREKIAADYGSGSPFAGLTDARKKRLLMRSPAHLSQPLRQRWRLCRRAVQSVTILTRR